MTFAWPWLFLVLPLPWLLRRLVPSARTGAALYLPHREIRIEAARTGASRGWRVPVAILAWTLCVAAAARPQWLAPPQSVPRSGRALMLAVDLSGSMAIEDMDFGDRTISRFAAVKAIAGQFIEQREGDEVGLILFGTHAFLMTPLTFDLHSVAQQLDGTAIGLAGRETAIGDAIALAVKHMANLPLRARVLVLLTDGVNTAGTLDPIEAAKLAAAAHVRIYTIGVGSGAGAMDLFGLHISAPDSDLDTATLTTIARLTGGQFFRAADGGQLAAAYRAVAALEPLARGDVQLRPRAELYPWPLALALLLAWALLPWRAALPRAAEGA